MFNKNVFRGWHFRHHLASDTTMHFTTVIGEMAETQTTTWVDLPINQPIKKTNETFPMHAHTEDLASKSQENARNQTSTSRGKLHPRELLIRLFPTQRRGALKLIFKGCHGEVLGAIEFVLTSLERALAALKTPETAMMHYDPSIPKLLCVSISISLYIARHQLTGTPWWSTLKGLDWDRRAR